MVTEYVGDCEVGAGGWLYQPANAVSSLGYVVVAIVLLLLLRPRGLTPLSVTYVVVLALVGLTSADFHGPRSPVSQWSHDLLVVALLALAGMVPLIRLWRRDRPLPGSSPARAWIAAGLLAIALVTWLLGRTDSALCDPEAAFQWHALWHLLSALVFGLWGLLLFARPDVGGTGGTDVSEDAGRSAPESGGHR